MTRVAIPIEDMAIGETDNIVFDYRGSLNPLETIVSAVVTIKVASGTDPSPNSMLLAAPQAHGAQVVQKVTCISAGVSGVSYDILCLATTSQSRVRACSALMKVVTL